MSDPAADASLVRVRGVILERERQSDWVKAILDKEI